MENIDKNNTNKRKFDETNFDKTNFEYLEKCHKEGNIFFINKDYANAVKCYLHSARYDYVQSQLNLGLMYFRGIGIKKNLNESFRWFTFASNNNNEIAKYYLFLLYVISDKPERYRHAFILCLESAKMGYTNAVYMLGHLSALGYGCEQNFSLAQYCFNKIKEKYPYSQAEKYLNQIKNNQYNESIDDLRKKFELACQLTTM